MAKNGAIKAGPNINPNIAIENLIKGGQKH
jgi:hypothetical protein